MDGKSGKERRADALALEGLEMSALPDLPERIGAGRFERRVRFSPGARLHEANGLHKGFRLRDFQARIQTSLFFAKDFDPIGEPEVPGDLKGFADLLVLSQVPKAACAYLFEFKHLPKSEATDAAVEAQASAASRSFMRERSFARFL